MTSDFSEVKSQIIFCKSQAILSNQITSQKVHPSRNITIKEVTIMIFVFCFNFVNVNEFGHCSYHDIILRYLVPLTERIITITIWHRKFTFVNYFIRALYNNLEWHCSFSCSMISKRSLRMTRRVL